MMHTSIAMFISLGYMMFANQMIIDQHIDKSLSIQEKNFQVG